MEAKLLQPPFPSTEWVICEAFTESPTLCLTCAQAQRLWALDMATCVRVLENLVNIGFLRYTDEGRYCRADHVPPEASSFLGL